ncbi:MAG: winged helix-turn-helix transcriptional regulator [Candidatus Lokiarchaeota archaeon]|nr:winged helix-turn-helix transcriptional regulator [Candidatus Lokiarchaeota archaeon]
MSEHLENLSTILKALADPTRLKLISLLMFNDEDKRRVIDLAEKIGISQPAITQHIKILKDVNLVKARREQNKKFYFINKKVFESYKKILNKALEEPFMRCSFEGKCSDCPNNQNTMK